MRALAVAWQVLAIAFLLYVLQATIRGWWVQDHADKAYTANKFQPLKGGESDAASLGLVADEGEQGLGTCSPAPGSPCRYCGVVDGHTAQCPVVSFGVVN